MEASRTNRPASHHIISRCLALRSTTTPAGSEISRKGSVDIAPRTPTCNVEAFNTRTAIIGSASWVTALPSSLTDCPPHRSMKSRSRHNEARGACFIRVSLLTASVTPRLCPRRHPKVHRISGPAGPAGRAGARAERSADLVQPAVGVRRLAGLDREERLADPHGDRARRAVPDGELA